MRSTDSLIIRYIARCSVPFIQLYALYVLGHGEDGPGGGFQGGVIFASSFVLLGLANGWGYGRRAAPSKVLDVLLPIGCMIYVGIGLVALLMGGMFLEYGALARSDDPLAQQHWHHYGLIIIEIGVLTTVAAAMATLFFEMSRPPKAQARVDRVGEETDRV